MAAPDDNIPTNNAENGMSVEPTQPQAPKSAPFLGTALPPIGAAMGESGDSTLAGCSHAAQNSNSQNVVGVEPMDADDLERSSSNLGDMRFDTCIGHIEDIIMEDEFQLMQTTFLDQYYTEFDDSEENKFSYTDIHNQYVKTVERYLDIQLTQRMPGFSMTEFAKQLQEKHRDEVLDGEIFEILFTFTDFMAFKEMMLDHRAAKEGRSTDLSGMLTVVNQKS